jgi:hypothetical protein
MRRALIFAAGILPLLAALPQSASARPRGLPGLLGAITSPIGAILGAGRHRSRGHRAAHHARHYARGVVSRPAAAAAAASVPAVGAAASRAAAAEPGPAHQPSTPEPAPKAGANIDQSAKPAVTSSSEAGSSQAATAHAEAPAVAARASAPATPAETAPAPMPAQRNAALSLPNNELRSSIKEPPSGAAPSPETFHLGRVGPLTWPSAYEDVIGYALWPEQYGQQLRTHGIADVLGAVFISPATLAAKARINNKARAADTGAVLATAVCANANAGSGDWPASEVARAITLTEPQRSALDQLKTSIHNSVASIASTCRDTADLSPVERLQAMQSTLWAVHDAALLIRAPLAAFFDSLSDDQKKQFASPATEDVAPHAMSRGEMARICGMPASLESSMRQIERSLQTGKAQRASLDALNKRSFEMGQFLMASCLKPVPATPTERIDSAADRLTAVLFAASNLGPAVNDFYGQLSSEQKAKLKTLR